MERELKYNSTGLGTCIWIGGSGMFGKKKVTGSYDKESQRPVIRSSICTGEQIAGFKDIHTGRFTEVMVIRTEKDMEAFFNDYGVSEEEIKKEW